MNTVNVHEMPTEFRSYTLEDCNNTITLSLIGGSLDVTYFFKDRNEALAMIEAMRRAL